MLDHSEGAVLVRDRAALVDVRAGVGTVGELCEVLRPVVAPVAVQMVNVSSGVGQDPGIPSDLPVLGDVAPVPGERVLRIPYVDVAVASDSPFGAVVRAGIGACHN